MLPPVDPAILQRNPNFELLLKDLCTRKLNHDASTRDTRKQRVHEEIRRVSGDVLCDAVAVSGNEVVVCLFVCLFGCSKELDGESIARVYGLCIYHTFNTTIQTLNHR